MITDSLLLFDVTTKSSSTAEKNLMIDLMNVKGSYQRREMDIIRLHEVRLIPLTPSQNHQSVYF